MVEWIVGILLVLLAIFGLLFIGKKIGSAMSTGKPLGREAVNAALVMASQRLLREGLKSVTEVNVELRPNEKCHYSASDAVRFMVGPHDAREKGVVQVHGAKFPAGTQECTGRLVLTNQRLIFSGQSLFCVKVKEIEYMLLWGDGLEIGHTQGASFFSVPDYPWLAALIAHLSEGRLVEKRDPVSPSPGAQIPQ